MDIQHIQMWMSRKLVITIFSRNTHTHTLIPSLSISLSWEKWEMKNERKREATMITEEQQTNKKKGKWE